MTKASSNRNWIRYGGYLILVLVLLYSIKIALKPSDFTVFLEAASMISEGASPYNQWIFVSEGNFCFYFYSPLWAVILIPFSYLPQFVPQFLWLLANVYFLYRIWILLNDYLNVRKWSRKIQIWFVLLLLAFSIRFLLYNFEMIQMTIFLVWGSLESLKLIQQDRALLGGALLAFVINVKLLPLVLLPYLIYRKKFKAVSFVTLFSILFLLLPALFLGWDMNLTLLEGWVEVINPTNAEHLIEADLGPHSLTALIPILFTETIGVLPDQRHLMSLTQGQAILLMNAVRLVLILFTLYFVQWPPFKSAQSKAHQLYGIAYLFLLIPLIFPHQQKYAFFCLVPVVYYCLFYLFQRYVINKETKGGHFSGVIVLLSLAFLLLTGTTDGLVGRSLNELFQHYKLITYGALLFIFILVLCHPSSIIATTERSEE